MTDSREDQIIALTRKILRTLQGHSTETGLAALGCTIQYLLDAVEPDERLLAAQHWCAILLETAEASIRRDHVGHA